MDPTHLHLLVNHLPIVGTFLGVALMILALVRRTDAGALHAAALVLVLAGAGAVVAEESGEGAEEMVEDLAGTDEAALHVHEERAEVATPLALLTALFAAGAVVTRALRPGTLSTAATVLTLASAAASSGVMAWVGQSGGLIRHSELRGTPPATAPGHGLVGERDHEDVDGD